MATTYTRRVLLSFFVTVVVMVSVGAAIYANFRQMSIQKERVEHTYTVIFELEQIISGLIDVQSAPRGFVITGEEEVLAPYYAALPKITDGMAVLAELIRDNPAQTERIRHLLEQVTERLHSAETILSTYRKEGAQEAGNLIRNGIGRQSMQNIRMLVAQMIEEESKLLTQRREAVENASRLTLLAGGISGFITLFILAMTFSQILREAARRTRTEESLRHAHGEMERINNETQMLARLGDYLRSCRTEEEGYDLIARNLQVMFPGTYGRVSIFNNSRNLLQSMLHWGDLPTMPNECEPDSCWALRQGRLHYNAGENEIPVCDHLQPLGRRIVSACLPMQAHGETIGQIFIGADDVAALGVEQVATLRLVTEQISLALANLALQRALKEQSIKDALTKLYNRRYLEETMSRECSRAERNNQTLCVMILDVDHFKNVNDTYGHDAGDAVLVAFASVLQKKSRKEDIACRLGGEEFVLVLPGANLEQAMIRAEEIRTAVEQMIVRAQKQTLNITVSIGVATFPEHGTSPEDLLHHADSCLYRAKKNGRNQVVSQV